MSITPKHSLWRNLKDTLVRSRFNYSYNMFCFSLGNYKFPCFYLLRRANDDCSASIEARMAQQGKTFQCTSLFPHTSTNNPVILQCNATTQAGSSIRQAILKEQEGYPTPPACLLYDVSIRNVFDYEQSSNQIKVFLVTVK